MNVDSPVWIYAAEEIMGQPVTRDQMHRWCGGRDGSQKAEKLKEQSDG